MRNLIFLTLVSVACLMACGKEVPSPGPDVWPDVPTIETSSRQLVLTEQASGTICIYDQPTRLLLWQWNPAESVLSEARAKWFLLPDEAKPVYNKSCLLVTASKGGLALVRIRDSKVLFYCKPAGNPHSAEVLPDGNIVCASSDGYLTLWKCDTVKTYGSGYIEKLDFPGVHNVVWDRDRSCLWCAGDSEMRSYLYDGNSLLQDKSIALPSMYAHDLTPDYGKDRLFLTTGTEVLYFNPSGCSFEPAPVFRKSDIKSISTGETGYTAIYTAPSESWYTPEVLELTSGKRVFYREGMQIYKARWMAETPFSYPDVHVLE